LSDAEPRAACGAVAHARQAYDVAVAGELRRCGGTLVRHLVGPRLRTWRFSSLAVHERIQWDRLELAVDLDDPWQLPAALKTACAFASAARGNWDITTGAARRRSGERRQLLARLRWWNTVAARDEAARLVLAVCAAR
jgi:hypothetical protein